MLIRLVDKHGFKSPILFVHCDHGEFLKVINEWKIDLLAWSKEEQGKVGMPLSNLEISTCIVDLMRVLIEHYVKTSPYAKGRVIGTLRLFEKADVYGDTIKDINIFEED